MSNSHIVVMRMYGTRDLPAVVRHWYKNSGEWVCLDDQLCIVETRKAAYDVISDGEGYLTQIAHEGAIVRVGHPLAELSSEMK